jgi:hypothetical protein
MICAKIKPCVTALPGKGLLLLAYYYLPGNTSGVQRAVRLTKYLPRNGYATHVVCSSYAGSADLENVIHLPGPACRMRAAHRWAAYAALLERFLPYSEQLPWVPYAVAASSDLIQRRAISCVISTSPPVATHLAAVWLKRRYRLKWIADFRDPLLGNPGRPRRWARPYDAFLQWLIFHFADGIIAVTDAVAAEWRRQYPACAHKIHVVWNGFDPEDRFGPAQLPERPYRLLSHVGVLYSQRHPLSLLASLDRLVRNRQLDPQAIRLRFTGPIQNESALLSYPSAVALLERGCLELRGELIPRSDAMREIATSDFLLLLDIVNLTQVGYTVPAKLYDYILTGRPILAITDPNSPVQRILAGSGIRYTCLYHGDSGDEIDRKVLAFLQFSSEPLAPSSWFRNQFAGDQQAAAVAALLDDMSEA